MSRTNPDPAVPTWRGVNLGNWLLLERWMKPTLFDASGARDEFSLCQSLGGFAEAVIRRHRETYITAEDFAWLRKRGLNAVRIPVGYWLFQPERPFVGGAEIFDQALAWCREYGLAAIIDLHGLPGFQSTEHHTGRSQHFRWPADADCLRRSLDLVELVAQRYHDHPAIAAISLVNEPSPEIPADALRGFYEQAYERVRRHIPPERAAVVIAAFTEARLPGFHRCLRGAQNVLTDIHPYACFMEWRIVQLSEYAEWGAQQKAPFLRQVGPEDLIVGEWSLGIAGALQNAVREMTDAERTAYMQRFAQGQLTAYNQTAGWFFWNYKVEAHDPLLQQCWSFRDATELGWLPQRW